MSCSCGLCREISTLIEQALLQGRTESPELAKSCSNLASLYNDFGELSEAPEEGAEKIREEIKKIRTLCGDEDLCTRVDWALEEYITISDLMEELDAVRTRPKYVSKVVGRLAEFSKDAIDLLPFRPKGGYTVEILEMGKRNALARVSTEIGTHQKAIYIFLFLRLEGSGDKPKVSIGRGIVETDIPLEPSIRTEAFKEKIYNKIEIKLLHERFTELSLPPEAVEALVRGSSWYSELADLAVVPPLSQIVEDFKPHKGCPTHEEVEKLETEIRPTILGYLLKKVQSLHQEIADLKAAQSETAHSEKELSEKIKERNLLFGMMKLRLLVGDNTTLHIHDHTIQKVTTMPLPHTIDVHIKTWEDKPCIARLLNKAIREIQKQEILEHTIMEVKSVLLPRPKVVPPKRIEVESVLERYPIPDEQTVLVFKEGKIRTGKKKLEKDLGLKEVLIRVLSSAVDVDECDGAESQEGLVPGNKFAGTVAALGRDVKGLAIGDMVVGVPILRCGKCPNCMESGACSEPLKLGSDIDGSHVQFIKLPDENILRIPFGRINLDSRPDAACLAEALAIAEHAVTKSTVFSKKGIMDYQLRKPILVLGTNLVALNILQRLLEGYSNTIIVVDQSEEKLERLKGLPDAPELLGRRIYPVLATSVTEAVSKVLELAGRRIRMIFNALGTRRSMEVAYRVMDVYAILVNVAYTTEELGGLHTLIEGKKITIYDCAMVPFDELRVYMEMALISMSYSKLEPWRFKALRLSMQEAVSIMEKIYSRDRAMMNLSQITIKPQT